MATRMGGECCAAVVRVRDRVVVVERAERRLGVHEVDVVRLEEAPVPVAGRARALLAPQWRELVLVLVSREMKKKPSRATSQNRGAAVGGAAYINLSQRDSQVARTN